MSAQHLSKQGEWFWGGFIIFIILAALIYYAAVRNWASCKTRAVLFNQRVLMFLGFALWATAGFISGAVCWHLFIAVLIFEVIIAFVVACRHGAFRRRGRYDSECNSSAGSASAAGSCDSNRGSGRGAYCWNWRLFLYRVFWDTVGFLFGLFLLRDVMLPKGLWYSKLGAVYLAAAVIALLLIGLIWQVGWTQAREKARCVMLNRRTWLVVFFVMFWFLGAVSGLNWVAALVLILVYSAVRWGLAYSWSFFCASSHYYWQCIVVSFIAAILGTYVVRYFYLANGAYLECAPIFMKHRMY